MKTTHAIAILLQAIPLTLLSYPAYCYDAVPVSGGGKIEGRVTYQGPVPMRKIIPNKDVEVCGGARDEAEVLVGADKGVQDGVVYLKEVAKGKAWGKADKIPVLDNKHCDFEPKLQVIRPGTVNVHNSDPVLHNTHAYYGRRTAFNMALPNKGVEISGDLPRAGLVRVDCDAHGWMLAHIYVADSPYYALTGKDGSFSITDVPPGQYTLVASQWYLGDQEMAVEVKGGETVKLPIELKKK
ncbi:MAG TPA: hypothetical protein VMH26_20695 [Burkholderiales bacterium]|nr:hypothetical protein [Burkholderiales bacterium]